MKASLVSQKKLNPVQQQHVVRWQKLTFQIAAKFCKRKGISPHSVFGDHLLSTAVMALIRAAQGFDESRGLAFGTYLGPVVYDRLNKELVRISRRGFRFAPKTDLKVGVVNEDNAICFDASHWTAEERHAILRLIDLHCDELTADIAKRHFFENGSIEDIAADLEIDKADVKHALRSLKKCDPLKKAMRAEMAAII